MRSGAKRQPRGDHERDGGHQAEEEPPPPGGRTSTGKGQRTSISTRWRSAEPAEDGTAPTSARGVSRAAAISTSVEAYRADEGPSRSEARRSARNSWSSRICRPIQRSGGSQNQSAEASSVATANHGSEASAWASSWSSASRRASDEPSRVEVGRDQNRRPDRAEQDRPGRPARDAERGPLAARRRWQGVVDRPRLVGRGVRVPPDPGRERNLPGRSDRDRMRRRRDRMPGCRPATIRPSWLAQCGQPNGPEAIHGPVARRIGARRSTGANGRSQTSGTTRSEAITPARASARRRDGWRVTIIASARRPETSAAATAASTIRAPRVGKRSSIRCARPRVRRANRWGSVSRRPTLHLILWRAQVAGGGCSLEIDDGLAVADAGTDGLALSVGEPLGLVDHRAEAIELLGALGIRRRSARPSSGRPRRRTLGRRTAGSARGSSGRTTSGGRR